MSDDNTSKSTSVIVVVAVVVAAIVLLPGALIAMLLVHEEDKDTCTAPNGGQALTVVEGTLPDVPGYTADQLKLAAIVMNVAKNEGLGEQAQLIGIITIMQESTMGANQSTWKPNGDGDSGPFQQRQYPGWYGSLEQVNDPTYAATAFYRGVTAMEAGGYGSVGGTAKSTYGHIPGLVDITGWETMEPGAAAQAVQKSAYPKEYTKHIPEAQKIMSALSGVEVNVDPNGVGCTPPAAGDVASALERAQSLLGTTYVFGGGDKNGITQGGIDCSGLVLFAFNLDTSVIGRTAQNQFDSLAGNTVGVNEMQPGDLIFYAYGRKGPIGSPSAVDHVGIYLGDSQMIEASNSAHKVRTATVRTTNDKGFVEVRRIPAATTTPQQ